MFDGGFALRSKPVASNKTDRYSVVVDGFVLRFTLRISKWDVVDKARVHRRINSSLDGYDERLQRKQYGMKSVIYLNYT